MIYYCWRRLGLIDFNFRCKTRHEYDKLAIQDKLQTMNYLGQDRDATNHC